MDHAAFMNALSTDLFPMLRAQGFRGSGTTLRRVMDPVIHVINVQAASGGSMCFLNLGAHLTFLPTAGEGKADAKKLKEYECVFRDRFDPPAGPAFGWPYGQNKDEMKETTAFICDHWRMYAQTFFDKYTHFPTDFVAIIEGIDASAAHPIDLLTFARIAAQIRDNTRAQSLASEALKRCPERASGLRANLNKFLRELPRI